MACDACQAAVSASSGLGRCMQQPRSVLPTPSFPPLLSLSHARFNESVAIVEDHLFPTVVAMNLWS